MLTLFALGTLAVLLLAGLPIAYSLGLAGLVTLYLIFGEPALIAVPQMMFVSLDSFTLLSVPFFVLAADILVAGGVTRHLIVAVETLFGHIRGGLATVAVLACAFFSAISGSSAATAIAVGSVLVPEMMRRGYDPKYSAGLVAVGGSLGILIPPSIPMIVFGNVAEESVGKLFLAGLIPGLILTAALIAVAMVVFGKQRAPRAGWPARRRAFREAVWILLLPVVIAIVIYGGIATPTEAAAVAAVYAIFVTIFLHRGVRIREMPRILADSAESSASIMLILAGATVFGYMLTTLQIPQDITARVLQQDMSPVVFLLVVNVVLLILGCFLDIISILLLTSPIFLPIAKQLGIDLIHFAVIFVVNMELALITPPLGVHLFILSSITKQPIGDVLKGAVPFALTAFAFLMLVTYVPAISLMLVR